MGASDAIKIYQRVLDTVSEAMLRGDHQTVAKHIALPFHMRTCNGWFPHNTPEDIEHVVQSIHLSLKMQGATDYVRIATSAEFQEDGSIDGVHKTHILRNGTPIVPAYESRIHYKQVDGIWVATTARHAMENHKWPISMPNIGNGDLGTVDTSSEIDEIAIQNYQDYIDALTAINVSGKFDDWLDVCEFPHMVHIDQAQQLIETHDDIRPFFDMVTDLVQQNPTATFKRTTDFAGFLDSHTLRGYHTATFNGPNGEVFAPVRSRMTIRFSDQKWRMIEVVNSIANTEFPYNEPIVSDQLASEFHYPKKVK